MTGRRGFAAAVALAYAHAPAMGRDAGPGAAVPLPPRPPPALVTPEVPVDPRLDRLAELMGTLAFLRDLCGAGDGAVWRGRMDALLHAEDTSTATRERLAGSYNRGYAGYQQSYHGCTPAAQVVIARALNDGARLATDLSLAEPKP